MTAPAVETQTHLVEVEFKGNRRVFYQFQAETAPSPKAAVIVQVDRGEDLGRIYSTGELAETRKVGTTHGKAAPSELPKVVRLAKPEEVDRSIRLRADEHAVRKAAIEFARELKLDLKVSDTEWQWDRRKMTVYFTAEERVDFRELVRRLERRFSTRVHMWHIGVRDEARRLDGIGRCGRQFCSASWLPELRPVKSSTAKDQRLSTLNPSQISGTCGRLMCCLRHEHEFYVQQRKRFPKEGKVIQTALGEEKVVSNDIFRDLVTLRTVAGEHRTIPLAQLRKETAPGVVPTDDEAAAMAGTLVTLGRGGEDDADDQHESESHDGATAELDDEALAEARRTRALGISVDKTPREGDPGSGPSKRSAEHVGAVPDSAERDQAEPDSAEPDSAEPDSAEPDNAEPDSAAPAGSDGERRRRRRRGRRGGRRGRGPRGNGEPGSGPSGGPGGATPPQ
ncbi:MAG: hypothetical protein KF709_09415 [Gemmatimonadaceae bacterium]|nr:hypothetical protein [Gemmatimonadaceae bacterium]